MRMNGQMALLRVTTMQGVSNQRAVCAIRLPYSATQQAQWEIEEGGIEPGAFLAFSRRM
jgi:hypothetical protein